MSQSSTPRPKRRTSRRVLAALFVVAVLVAIAAVSVVMAPKKMHLATPNYVNRVVAGEPFEMKAELPIRLNNMAVVPLVGLPASNELYSMGGQPLDWPHYGATRTFTMWTIGEPDQMNVVVLVTMNPDQLQKYQELIDTPKGPILVPPSLITDDNAAFYPVVLTSKP